VSALAQKNADKKRKKKGAQAPAVTHVECQLRNNIPNKTVLLYSTADYSSCAQTFSRCTIRSFSVSIPPPTVFFHAKYSPNLISA
jgi:hypothetical protein